VTAFYEILRGDCISMMQLFIPDESVDAVVCDPPYELGFMGKGWDSTGIANSVEMWREALRVLKPGGHLLAFSGSRTYHRMTCAIEDAGFEVRDQMMWIYGSGFPKSSDVSKAIDKTEGHRRGRAGAPTSGNGSMNGPNYARVPKGEPATDAARQWQGWGTALKPAHEPICVARKPLIGTVAANVLAHGTGGLNIDGCRVEASDKTPAPVGKFVGSTIGPNGHSGIRDGSADTLGRWPANLMHDGSDEVLAAFPGDEQRFFYCPKASKTDRGDGNIHPTVKPTELMRYLCRLVTPPGGVVLDPFMGSGSTGKAAVHEGFTFIGCELSEEYADIAEARIQHAAYGDIA
jgi:hypothetical protein